MRRSIIYTILILVLLASGCAVWQVVQWRQVLYTPMLAADNPAVEITIPPGMPLISLAWQLKRQGLLQNPDYLVYLARLHGDIEHIKAGEYLIAPGKTTAAQFLDNIVSGRIILRQLTIVEGWNFNQVMAAVNTNPYLTHSLNHLDNATIMQKLGYSGIDPEGRFYPDTYLFGKGTADTKILRKAYTAMDNLLAKQWAQRAHNLAYQKPIEALTVASLIERETSLDRERPLIAGVINRRLQKNMRLQIDATIIYALGANYSGKLSRNDLTVRSAYNTYLHAGLPPTPIAMPSRSSLYAALHPAAGDALYYVATGRGGHTFSATLKAHDMAIDKYRWNQSHCFSFPLFLAFLQKAFVNYSPIGPL